LEAALLRDLIALGREIGMEPLVEVPPAKNSTALSLLGRASWV